MHSGLYTWAVGYSLGRGVQDPPARAALGAFSGANLKKFWRQSFLQVAGGRHCAVAGVARERGCAFVAEGECIALYTV